MEPTNYREKAEAIVQERAARAPEDSAALSLKEIQKTLHELHIHQVDLEMQNEELRAALAEFEAERAQGFDFYDLAPAGYCARSEQGSIQDANHAVASRLGATRSLLRKQAQEKVQMQLQQAQIMEPVGQLAAGVAHEINNPIMGIMNYAQLILDSLGPEHELAEYAREIGNETERVATIIKNLLSFASQDNQNYSPARINDIVESVLSLVLATIRYDQIDLEMDVPEDLPIIKCRSQQIQQVIINLINNARYALNQKYPDYDKNKRLSIKAAAFDKDGKRWVRITVSDTGPGIPDEVRDRMFEPFYSTRPRDKCTGLGLCVSLGIVKSHHGTLSVETKVGEWTRFYMDIPTHNE